MGTANALAGHKHNRGGLHRHTWDARSELWQTHHRPYDPSLGRWLAEDPIGLDGGGNLYAYARQNPLAYWDPDGLSAAAAWRTFTDVMGWVTGTTPTTVYGENAPSTQDLRATPAMDEIRKKYLKEKCKSGRYVQVVADNTWGLESGTRLPAFPGAGGNRFNSSVQQMLGGGKIQYPKSILEDRR